MQLHAAIAEPRSSTHIDRTQVAQAASGEAVLGAAPVWHPLDIKAFVGVSGAYDLEGLAEHLHRCLRCWACGCMAGGEVFCAGMDVHACIHACKPSSTP